MRLFKDLSFDDVSGDDVQVDDYDDSITSGDDETDEEYVPDNNPESKIEISQDQSDEGPSGPKRLKINPLYNRAEDQEAGSSGISQSFNKTDQSDSSDVSESEDDESDKEIFDENDDEDDLIKSLKKAQEKPDRKAPPDIRIGADVSDISFHPENEIIAVASMDGSISIFHYTIDTNELKKKLLIHKKTVRSLEYDDSGENLFTASRDGSLKIIDAETFAVKRKTFKAHDRSSLYRIKPINDHLYATGDEDGTVKLWDRRTHQSVMEEKPFEEFITDMHIDDEKKLMVVTSGEGTLQSFNIRGKKLDTQSEVYEGQLNCVGTLRSGTKTVVGCDDGKLYLFKSGLYGLHEDKYPGHPDSINCLIPVTDNVIITGCEDGSLRAVHLYPHRFLGVVGQHDNQFPIERIDVSSDGHLVASISHDQKVKFRNIQYLEECDYVKTRKPYKHPGKMKVKKKENKMRDARENEFQLPSSNRSNKRDFFKDLAEDT